MKNNKFVLAIMIPGFGMILLFCIIPLVYGLGMSFFAYSGYRVHSEFVGLENYRRLWEHISVVKKVVGNTFKFSIITVMGNFIISLLIAQIIVNLDNSALKTVFRSIFFLPCIAPAVGTAMVWKSGLLATDGGIFNQILEYYGVNVQNWLGSTEWLLNAIIIFTLWADIGFNILLFSVALENIPKEIIEAAKMDGAGKIRTFFKVKLPLMGRTFSFVCVTTVISYFQAFTQFKVLSKTGGANYSATVLPYYIYMESFKNNNMSYASTIAMLSFVILMIITLIQIWLTKIDWSYE